MLWMAGQVEPRDDPLTGSRVGGTRPRAAVLSLEPGATEEINITHREASLAAIATPHERERHLQASRKGGRRGEGEG